MIKIRLDQYVKENQDTNVSNFIIFSYTLLNGLFLFLATLNGYIPSHVIRHVFYRRLFKVKIPSDSIIYWRCRFFSPQRVKIGHNSIIGNDAFLDGRESIYIGDNVNIGGDVRIYTQQHDIESSNFGIKGAPVHIGHWAYIGARVIILPGVKIGEGAVVASGAVVTKDVEPWTMVGGVPAKFIRNRPLVKYNLDTNHRLFFQ
ncbi:acyltransferase [Methanobacterium congolense]|uniref:Putative acetyltransferase SACOL2570 n=1 Tax=Methanobacterium congolense TaxID=118062 RepID=A0A1D3L458_9EURY|nr:acyltransferase [Methanobacterium congolense]SCG86387.1 putative acetyltransferase SACOL2570 [Methanobacterium congolense]